MDSRVNEADVVGRVQDMLLDTQDVQDFLDELARFSAESMSGPRGQIYCGITLLRHRSAATVASSGEHAQAVDEIQYQFGDGPCLRSCREGVLVHVPDFELDYGISGIQRHRAEERHPLGSGGAFRPARR